MFSEIKSAILIAITFVLFAPKMKAQTLKEDFNSVAPPKLPSGWTQWNMDGKTVSSDLDILNFKSNAWISFAMDQNNTFVASTSRYNPAGASDDWLVTPPIKPENGDYLTWDAMSFALDARDGYEVRLSTTDSLPSSFTTLLFSIDQEESANPVSRLIDLSTYANKRIYIAFRNNSTDKYVLMLDNIVVGKVAKVNGSLVGITPTAGTANAYGIKGSNKDINVSLLNLGYDTIKNASIKYTDGVNTYTTPVNTNLPYKGVANLKLNPYLVNTLDKVNLKAWVEIAGDLIHPGDTINTSITGTTFWPKHRVTLEEATGTWCGWCPRGAVYMDSVHKVIKEDAVVIAVHNNDPMTVANYDAGLAKFNINGFPNLVTERKRIQDPSAAFSEIDAVKNDCGMAEIGIASIQKGSTVKVNTTVKFAINSIKSDDWRLALVVTEDGVNGKGSQYDQHNYYSKSSMELSGAGHNWTKEENPIPAERMTYDHVARYISDFNGTKGSLPDTVYADSTYRYTFTFALPTSVIHDFMCVANVLLINQSSGAIVNAVSERFTSLSLGDELINQKIDVYPNPTSGICNAAFPNERINKIHAVDALGKSIELNYTHDGDILVFDISHLNNGVYIVFFETENGEYRSKLVVSK